MVNIQSKNVGNDGRIARRSYNTQEESAEGSNVQKETGNNSMANSNFDEGRSYDSAFMKKLHESVILQYDDQINSDIIFDDPNVEVNDGSVEHDTNAHDPYDNELEQLARNAYKEAEKDKIRSLEKEKDDLQLNVSEQRKHVLEQKTTQTSLKRKFNANEDKYLDDVLNLEAKLKKNENVVMKMSNSAQAISKVHVNVCDTEEILEDATKSQLKMENKLKDPIAIEKKQNFRPIDYGKLNHDVEKYVLMCFGSMNDDLTVEIEKVKRESNDVQENLHKRIKILEYDVQRCQKQSLDFELQLQHEKEKTKFESSLKNLCETSWISKMKKLENENVSLEFQVQSLVKEREKYQIGIPKAF
ncbi:hypothetical protein Tco_0932040 [Tanacetum coccineum]